MMGLRADYTTAEDEEDLRMRIFFFSFRSFVSYSFLCGETKIAADRGKTLKWLIEGNSLKSFLWLTFRFERVRTPFQRFSFWLLAIQREQHIHILNSYLQRFAPSEIHLINVPAKIITLNRHCQGLWVVSESLKTWAWTSRDEIWAVLIYYPFLVARIATILVTPGYRLWAEVQV